MAYTLYDYTKPDPSTQTGTQFGTSTRNNLNSLRDAAILGGGMPWFNFSVTNGTGTADQPQYMFAKNGAEWIRATLTWVSGNVTVAVYDYSINTGADYTTAPGGRIGTKTITYDGNGNVTNSVWS